MPGSKHIYLGLFNDERDAARAYDRALVRLRGRGAATNFALGEYRDELRDYHSAQAVRRAAAPWGHCIPACPACSGRPVGLSLD